MKILRANKRVDSIFNDLRELDLKKIFDTEKVGNPISDIADSYFIQKVGYENSIKSK